MLLLREHQDLDTEGFGLCFRDAEGPGAAFDVAGILPYGLDTALEEVHGVFQSASVEDEVLQDLLEPFHSDDLLFQEGETAFTILQVCVFIVVEGPGVLEWWCAEVAVEVQSAGDRGVLIFGDWA